MSTEPQAAVGSDPRIELIAYSSAENERVAQRLATIAMMIASTASTDTLFKTFDTVDVGDLTQPDAQFALVPPDEVSDFCRFPDQKRNLQNLLFTKAVGEANDVDAHVTFLKLLPLTDDEAKFAVAKGTPALLKKFSGRAKHCGWGRGPKESVLLAKQIDGPFPRSACHSPPEFLSTGALLSVGNGLFLMRSAMPSLARWAEQGHSIRFRTART